MSALTRRAPSSAEAPLRGFVRARTPGGVGDAGGALGRGREVHAQRTLDGDAAEGEVGVVEDARALALGEGAVGREDGRAVFVADLVALLAEGAAHLVGGVRGVDELHLALAGCGLAVRDDPDVGADAGVEEELIGQGDDGLDEVAREEPAADLALAAPGVAGEEGRAVEDDGDARAAERAGDGLHLRDHELKKEQRAVAHAGQARGEGAVVALVVVALAEALFDALPVDAEGRVREHVVEALLGVAVVGEAVARGDVLRPVPAEHHVGLADGVGLVVELLAVEFRLGLGVVDPDALLGDGEHSAGSARGVVEGGLEARHGESLLIAREHEVDHELDDLARGVVLARGLVRLLREAPDEGHRQDDLGVLRGLVFAAEAIGDLEDEVRELGEAFEAPRRREGEEVRWSWLPPSMRGPLRI